MCRYPFDRCVYERSMYVDPELRTTSMMRPLEGHKKAYTKIDHEMYMAEKLHLRAGADSPYFDCN